MYYCIGECFPWEGCGPSHVFLSLKGALTWWLQHIEKGTNNLVYDGQVMPDYAYLSVESFEDSPVPASGYVTGIAQEAVDKFFVWWYDKDKSVADICNEFGINK